MNLISPTRRNIRDETFIKDEQGRWFDSSRSDHSKTDSHLTVRFAIF